MNRITLRIAWRNIRKYQTQSIISILGLGIGLGCILQLSILVVHEYSFDNFVPKPNCTFKILQGNDCLTSYPLAENAIKEIPSIKNYFRYYETSPIEYRNKTNDIVSETNFGFADPSIFECLGVRLISGFAAKSISEIVISEDMARKHFGTLSAVGNSMTFKLNNEFRIFTITGVYNNFPSNSSIAPNYICHINLATELVKQFQKTLGRYGNSREDMFDWNNLILDTYLVLVDNANPEKVAEGLNKYLVNIKNEKRKELTYSLQPITDIYLKSGNISVNQWTRQGNARDLRNYIAISLFILLIALLNYILLTRARIATRLKEFGTQKVLGASATRIRQQIVLESMIIVLISIIPATLVAFGNIPYISSSLGKNIGLSVIYNPTTWAIVIGILLVTGIVSGWIIGRSISNVSMLLLIKGKTKIYQSRNRLSNAFLTIHFAVFIILFVGVIILNKQIRFATTNFKAIDPTNIIISELNSPELSGQFSTIENEIKKVPGVIMTAGSSFIPPFNNFLPITLAAQDGEKMRFDGLIMGKGMIELLGLKVIEGRSFGDFVPNTTEVVFNESAAKKYKIEVGKIFIAFPVKGIVEDFHAHSMHSEIQPMVIIQQQPDRVRLVAVKTDGKNDALIISKLNEMVKNISPNDFISTYHLTDQIDNFYAKEQQQKQIIGSFAILAVILAIMGLFGMILIATARKTKEIGVRKVNGAKTWEIMVLINSDFIKWVLLAIAIAVPAAWYFANKWLQDFAYRTELSWWIFVIASLLSIIIAILTVSWQSWLAARKNPVEALRYE